MKFIRMKMEKIKKNIYCAFIFSLCVCVNIMFAYVELKIKTKICQSIESILAVDIFIKINVKWKKILYTIIKLKYLQFESPPSH